MLLNKPAIQQLKVDVVVCLEGGIALPFAFEPQSIVVPAIPPLDVPSVVVMPLTAANFRAVVEDIDQCEDPVLMIVDGRRPVLWRRERRSRTTCPMDRLGTVDAVKGPCTVCAKTTVAPMPWLSMPISIITRTMC